MDSSSDRPFGLYVTWLALAVAALDGLLSERYSVTFIALGTLALTALPFFAGQMLRIELPGGFTSAIAVFLYASLFLGEAGRFYERFWWWDIALHAGSAIGFGLVGCMIILVLVRSERLLSSAFVAAVFAFSFSVMIGVLWEIFEFGMDQTFGLNMQKSGLVDTMWDLIVNCLGSAAGATAGWAYLKGFRRAPLAAMIFDFVQRNPKFFGRPPAAGADAARTPAVEGDRCTPADATTIASSSRTVDAAGEL